MCGQYFIIFNFSNSTYNNTLRHKMFIRNLYNPKTRFEIKRNHGTVVGIAVYYCYIDSLKPKMYKLIYNNCYR